MKVEQLKQARRSSVAAALTHRRANEPWCSDATGSCPSGIQITLSQGDTAPDNTLYPCNSSRQYSTVIDVRCGSIDDGFATEVTYDSSSCTFSSWLYSPSGCVTCTPEMMIAEESACVNGQKTTRYVQDQRVAARCVVAE